MVGCVAWLRLRKEKRHHSAYRRESSKLTKASSERLPDQLCRCFSLLEIKMATNNFDQELLIGRGGFGNVYIGHLTDETSSVVTIKRHDEGSLQGIREFVAEIDTLSQIPHFHLIPLIGYCNDDDEMILVYDYMANGNLRDHLYGTENDPLPWKLRLEICIGAARGLHHLHTELENTIIHRDVKTLTVLLDEKWVAKVSDFGLSRIGCKDSAVSTEVKGTFGYVDPEYLQTRQLTVKSDVYSFGVVLFEVLCARKPVDVKLEHDQGNLTYWARKCIREGKIQNIVDPYLIGKIAPESFKKFVEVAERCVRDYRNQRPTMLEVIAMLEYTLELQEQADAARQGEIPPWVCPYPMRLSFHLADQPENDTLGLELDSESCTHEILSDATDSESQN